jgi:hypothetical protein
LEENDNLHPDTFRAIGLPSCFEFPVVLPSRRNNLATLALAKI